MQPATQSTRFAKPALIGLVGACLKGFRDDAAECLREGADDGALLPADHDLFSLLGHVVNNLAESGDAEKARADLRDCQAQILCALAALEKLAPHSSGGEAPVPTVAKEEVDGYFPLCDYPDPYLVKGDSVYVLRETEKDLCNAPLIANGMAFYRGDLCEVYANDFIEQAEIDAIIAALTPAPPPEGDGNGLICPECASGDTELKAEGKAACLECDHVWKPDPSEIE